MKVVVINIVTLNPGDAAILQGSIEILQRAFGGNVSVTVFDRDGAAAARYYPWASFRPALFIHNPRGRLYELAKRRGWMSRVYRLQALRLRLGGMLLARKLDLVAAALLSPRERDALRTYLEADLVICSGGTYLVPHYNLLRPLLDCELVAALGRPLVFFPQSLGPFDTTPLRARLRQVFAHSIRVVVRDQRSADHLRQLGVPEAKILIAADAAFALSLPMNAATAGAAHAPPSAESVRSELDVTVANARRPRIAISVREWAYPGAADPPAMQERYMAALAAATTNLVRSHGAQVTFLSTCQGMPEYWTDDSVFAQRIVARLDSEVAAFVSIDTHFRQPLTFVQELAAFDAVIATRMHAAILALCAGVPVLPIAYEFKTRELFRAIGLEQWVTDIVDMEPAMFTERADCFVRQLAELRGRVGAGTAERRASALSLVTELKRALHG